MRSKSQASRSMRPTARLHPVLMRRRCPTVVTSTPPTETTPSSVINTIGSVGSSLKDNPGLHPRMWSGSRHSPHPPPSPPNRGDAWRRPSALPRPPPVLAAVAPVLYLQRPHPRLDYSIVGGNELNRALAVRGRFAHHPPLF